MNTHPPFALAGQLALSFVLCAICFFTPMVLAHAFPWVPEGPAMFFGGMAYVAVSGRLYVKPAPAGTPGQPQKPNH